MVASPHADKFAACLRMLKDRSGRGYDRLGKEAGVSGSSLHRYCSGLSVPTDYRVVHAFAKVCGASAEELREVHRLWALADTDRDTPAVTEEADPGPAEPAGPEPLATEPAPDDITPPEPVPGEPARPRRFRVPETLTSRFAVLAAAVVVTLVAGLVWLPAGAPAGASPARDDRLLYSPACESVSMGQHDACVREVQTLLTRAKGRLAVDGDFGPETLRRLTAFQVLAGVPARSVVDDATKKALYGHTVSMATWSPARVTKRIRAVFVEDPDTAVAIARCSSFLDPLWVLPNTNGSRNWGVFQISDASLRELDGTPLRAFDPEWNIEAAHRLWSVRRDFHDWPSCEAALKDTPKH
ncbi:helix-turn-helix domain-containing protein [Streptomyces stelliscabiei]|nr:helix-turn-helix domain-containing protein [Streptomyces stelliscabiei]KND41721.1 peptidoglycan-binding protein [Streptomyces stelliscabiei]MDX2521237.1 helix-turn-helix domain-containing protein [Streptomyces stelliscabiei]MDX2550365.1 helix-turn-helix domain-containing protein [Streptomyces stelliscabiei]MDX2610063.1 helix-turn-helix domain-containing protein [Streptomyces stelliscabiei]MDX2635015.1 helix-turn-helix domain-containing protein [Streptomyces stelliscabiei]